MIAVLKKETDEPLKDAMTLYETMPPTDIYWDEARGEWVRLWDTEGFQSLESSNHPLRVIKAERKEQPHSAFKQIDWSGPGVTTWWMMTTIFRETLSGPKVFDAQRRRWDNESVNNDFTQNWFMKHTFIHDEVGTPAMAYIFAKCGALMVLPSIPALPATCTTDPSVGIAVDRCTELAPGQSGG